MTDNQKAQARVFFENRILKSDKQAFEDLFTEIMNYKELDFRSIKPWGNIGDRKNDGYIESRGIFYQVYAPEDIRKSYPDVIKKIKTDFNGLIEQWSNVREFYFVVNDKYKGVNPDSEQLLQQIKEDNNLVEAKFITAKDLENILFILSNDQIIKITGVTFLDSTILTSATLKNTYLKKFDTISLLTTNIPKPIDDIFINLAIIKEKNEEKNKENFINREAFLSSYEEIHKPKEPIDIKDLIDTSKKSLIYGKAGIGKTTLCKYIAYSWAKGELYNEFEYVVYIPLREWKNNGIKGAIQDYYYSRDSDKLTIDIASSKMLFLFDGYDELDSDRKKLLRDEIDTYSLTHYIITTRPYGYQKNDFRIDERFETIGFTDENVEQYIETFFKENAEKTKGLKDFLQSNISIKHIAYIPLMLEMICSLWKEEEFSESLTMTELYSHVVKNMLQKHNSHNKKVSKPENRDEIYKVLGKVALESLKKQKIFFGYKFLRGILLKKERSVLEKNAVSSGFMKSDCSEEDILDTNLEFIHLTFQEYFAAHYVSKISKKKQRKIIKKYKFYPHMQMFFAFLGGLINKEWFLNELENKPIDLLDSYIPSLVFICIPEINNQELINKKNQLLNYYIDIFSSIDRQEYQIKNKILDSVLYIKHIIDIDFIDRIIESSKDVLSTSIVLKKLAQGNQSIAYRLLELVENNESNIYGLENSLASVLTSLGINDNSFIDRLFEIVLDKNNKYHRSSNDKEDCRFLIANSLFCLEKTDDEFLDKLIRLFMTVDNFRNDIKRGIARSLKLLKRNDDIYFHKVSQILLKNDLDVYPRDNIMYKDDYRGLLATFIASSKKKEYEEILLYITDYEYHISHANRINILKLLILNKNTKAEDILLKVLKIRFINLDAYEIQEIIKILLSNKALYSSLMLLLRDRNIHPSMRFNFAQSLAPLVNKDRDRLFDLIDIVKNEKEENIRKAISISLTNLKVSDWRIRKLFFKILFDENESLAFRKSILDRLIWLGRKNKKIQCILFKIFILKETSTDVKIMMSEVLGKYNEYMSICVNIFMNKDIDIRLKNNIRKSFLDYNSGINEFFDLLISVARNKNIDTFLRRNILRYFKSLSSKVDKVTTILSEERNFFIKKDKTLDQDILNHQKGRFIQSLLDLSDNSEIILDGLIVIIKNKDRHFLSQDTIVHKIILEQNLNNSFSFPPEKRAKKLIYELNNKIIDESMSLNRLIEIVDEENIEIWDTELSSLRTQAIKCLSYLQKTQTNKLIQLVRDENIDDSRNTDIRNLLVTVSRFKKEELIKTFIQIIKEKKTYGIHEIVENIVGASENQLFIFNELKSIDFFYQQLVQLINLETLFTVYDQKKLSIEDIFNNAKRNQKPIYIKNNKFYTIENGKEISTQRDIDTSILKYFPKIKQQYLEIKKQVKPSKNRPLVITEGKTDWQHLKKALDKFKMIGLYKNLDIGFDEYENRGAGEAYLENQLKSYASHKQPRKIIGIFDRDTKKYVKEYGKQEFVKVLDRDYKNRLKEKIEKHYSDKSSPKYKFFEQNLESGNYSEIEEDIKKALTGGEYQEWKKLSENNVYAFCIPEIQDSDSSRELDAICIEFYYKERDLQRTTQDGKRLFFADEFEFNKEHSDKSERFISKCGKFKTESVKVKDGAKKELTLISTPVYDDKKQNVLLSKNDFTNHIINDVEGFKYFEIENFKLIFDVIEKIIND